MKYSLALFILLFCLTQGNAQNMIIPEMTDDKPSAGLRVKIIPKEYKGTGVYYSFYLPKTYTKGRKYPVIVEYTGNKWNTSGSTGEVKDAGLGYSIAKRLDAIWVVFPYIKDSMSITKWWGNEEETIEFALTNIRRICEDFGGNPAEVFICGFSRGAIGVNYLGLYNDQISDVWLGFFSHDHYDGVKEWKGQDWGTPLSAYRCAATRRFKRIKGRNCLISHNGNKKHDCSEIKKYIKEYKLEKFAGIQYNFVPITDIITNIPSELIPHEHTDKWLLYESEYADTVFDWFLRTIETKPNTFSVSGTVKDSNGNPVSDLIVESGKTHFAITNEKGEYTLEGLVAGNRTVSITKQKINIAIEMKEVKLESNVENLDFVIIMK